MSVLLYSSGGVTPTANTGLAWTNREYWLSRYVSESTRERDIITTKH